MQFAWRAAWLCGTIWIVSVNPLQHRLGAPQLLGRDELNLIDFPISLLQHQQPTTADGSRPDELVCTIKSYDRHLGCVVPRKLTRRTSSKHGFPTSLEDEVLIGLLTLTRLKNDFQSARVHFKNSELWNLMGWPVNGNSSKRLSIALDRLEGLTLKYENAWTTGDNRFKKEFTTGLLDSYELVSSSMAGASGESSWVQWSAEVFTDIQNGNVKELDTQRFFSLDRPISKRLYRYLDRHLAENPHLEADLLTLAAQLGISGTTHIGKIKERLQPAIEELEAFGDFIEKKDNRYLKHGVGVWIIHFDRAGQRTSNAMTKQTRSVPGKKRMANTETKKLVSDFYHLWANDNQRIVTKHELHQAKQIIDQYGADKTFEMLPKVVKLMQKHFPDARAFGGTTHYWRDADQASRRRERSTQSSTASQHSREEEQQRLAAQAQRRQRLRSNWESLEQETRATILDKVARHSDPTVRRFIAQGRLNDPLVEQACFAEMERRQDEPGPTH